MAKNPFKQLETIKIAAQKGRRITDCFRLLYKEELWLKALERLQLPKSGSYRTEAACLEEIRRSIENLRNGAYRRTFFASPMKGNEDVKPFLKEFLLLEAMRFILEAVFAHRISSAKHMEDSRAPFAALLRVKRTFGAYTWCIKGEIASGICSRQLLQFVGAKIDDRRFLYIIKKVLASGILKHRRARSFRGLLERICFSELDHFVQICAENYFRRKEHFGKINYIRSGREFVIGLSCTKQLARSLLADLEIFLYEQLGFSKSESRVQLFHLEKRVPFLGYEFCRLKQRKSGHSPERARLKPAGELAGPTDRKIILLIPDRKIREFARKKGYGLLENGVISHRKKLIHKTEEEILALYNKELKNFAQYYRLAANIHHLDKLFYIARGSFFKTVAAKRKSSVAKTAEHLRKKGLRIVSRRAVYFERSTYGSEGGEETCPLSGKAPYPDPTIRHRAERI